MNKVKQFRKACGEGKHENIVFYYLSLTIASNRKAPMRLAPGPSICSKIIKSESFPLTERHNVYPIYLLFILRISVRGFILVSQTSTIYTVSSASSSQTTLAMETSRKDDLLPLQK